MEDAGDIAERTPFDRIDERAHPGTPRGGEIDLFRSAASSLGDMSCSAVFAGIDDLSGKQGIAGCIETSRFRPRDETAYQLLVQMGFRPVEIESRRLKAEPAQPVGLSREQLVEPLDCWLLHCRRT